MSTLRPQRGVTLIELMVVVTVVGLLAAIAIPSYGQYRLRVSRSEGKSCIAEIQRREEAWFLRHDTYTTSLSALALPVSGGAYACGRDPVLYLITLSAPDGKTLGCCYRIEAIAQGAQAADGNLLLSYDSSQRDPALRLTRQRRLGASDRDWD